MTEETCQILQNFGYQFEQRGLVAVKGKGQLMTYYLLGKTGKISSQIAPSSPAIGINAMETVTEEDESHDSPTSKSEEKTIVENSGKIEENDIYSNGDLDANGSAQPLIEDFNSTRESSESTSLLKSD